MTEKVSKTLAGKRKRVAKQRRKIQLPASLIAKERALRRDYVIWAKGDRNIKKREERRRALSGAVEPERKGDPGTRYDINSFGGGPTHIQNIGVIKRRPR
jgi:hypothetical protein